MIRTIILTMARSGKVSTSEIYAISRFEVLMAVKMSMLIFGVVKPCGLVGRCHALKKGAISSSETLDSAYKSTALLPRRPISIFCY
jgi:hypothetical protein